MTLGRAVEAGGRQFGYEPGGSKPAEMDGTTLVRADIPLPGGGEAVYNAAGLAFYRHADWLGSARLTTRPGGGVYAAAAYAPYGETYAAAGAPDYSFTGQKADVNGDQYDFLMRDLNPTQGRWWTPDPAGLGAVNPGNPQTWNRYGYVNGNPMAVVDPSGLCGNVVIAGSAQAAGDAGVSAMWNFAASIGADIAFPFAGQTYAGSFASVEASAWGMSRAVAVAERAILHTAAQGGPFTVYVFSGGAQAAHSALRLLPAEIASRATVVGISPGFGLGPLSLLPHEALAVGGGGGYNTLVDATAMGNMLNPGPSIGTGCGHDANCEFSQSLGSLRAAKSPACNQENKTFSPTGGGSSIGDAFAMAGSLASGSIVSILQIYINSLTGGVSVTQGPDKICNVPGYPDCEHKKHDLL